jgi:uncharacterized membrane protein
LVKHFQGRSKMMKRILAAALATAFLSVTVVAPSIAEEKKKLTTQQQKMKDCAGKWKTEKETKKVSGRAAYNKFMSGCLKG